MATEQEKNKFKNLTEKDWKKIDKTRNILGIVKLIILVAFIIFFIYIMFLIIRG